jgi:hypothetical protein
MKQRHELRTYKHQEEMDKLNEMIIRIKVHLFNLGDNRTKHPAPSSEEIDNLIIGKIFPILKKEFKTF